MPILYCLFVLSIAITSRAATCGYQDGIPRTAQSGYECRVDTANGLWGFCPTTVSLATDCGLAGVCVDHHACTEGCGRLSDRRDITTFTCDSTKFCSTLLSINGPDQSYEYIACGAAAVTDKLFPTAEAITTPASPTSIPSSSVTSLASRPTTTFVETTSIPASSPSSDADSSLTPSTSGPIPTSSKPEPTNLGAIVGGVIGGPAVICMTIISVLFLRRKHGVKGQVMSRLGHNNHDRSKLKDDDAEATQKKWRQSSGHAPVEMYSGNYINMEPVELSGQDHGGPMLKTTAVNS